MKSSATGAAVLIILGILTAFGPMSMDMYLPAMPDLARYFATSPGNVQYTLSAFTIAFGAGQLIYGPVSDRLGRRGVLLAGITLYTLASVFCVYASSINELIVARFFQAIGGAAGIVLSRAIIRDVYDKLEGARALSLMLMIPSLAALIAPFIGGYLLKFFADWRLIFWTLFAFGMIAFILGVLKLPETHPPEKRQKSSASKILHDYIKVLCHRRAVGYMICGGLSFATMFAQLSGTPFIYIDLFGVAPEDFGLLFALNIFAIMAGSYLNSRLVIRFGVRRMLAVGTTIALIGGIGIAVSATIGTFGLFGIVIPVVIFMMPHNMVNANASAGTLEYFPDLAGTASAMLGFVRFGTGALVGALVGYFHDGTALPMAYIIACCVIGSAAAFWFLTGDPPETASEQREPSVP
ncbi:MAG: Bcr/CflA family drug resistance efflux transporter [Rhodospirillaceae bacterium]|nr:Bcr/CflA family drug resistance efflux transporter [Rhodospirillaceae bacterium]|tara:strand:+ start:15898 stop:17124 length:1227 start_codon:yes stop_codon:yes gene_type:complete